MKLIRWRWSSLRAKLLVMFVLISSVPMIVVGLVSYQKSFATISGHGKASALLEADGLARDIDGLFQDTSKLLELEENPQVLRFLFSQSDTYEDAKAILRTFELYRETYKYEDVLNISMVNLYGRGISERRGVFQLERNPLRNPHFVKLLSEPDQVLNVPPSDALPLDRVDGFQYEDRNVISIIATIKQSITKEVIGFIVIDLDDSIVRQFCDDSRIGKTGYFYVASSDGNPIFMPSAVKSDALPFQPADLGPRLAADREGFVERSVGKPLFVMYSTSQMTGWKIVGLVPLQELMKDADEIRQLIILSVTLSLAFTISLYFFVTTRLTRPVQVLMNKMRQAAGGYLEAKVKPTGSDEIADLGNSFNIMLGKIRELLDQSITERENIQKAELRTLQAQINPHFLYNTLDSIIWMAEAGKNEQVIRLVQALAKFFRIGLNKGMEWVTLKEELEHVRSYLVIQQMRYRDILDYEIVVPDSLLNIRLLKMTIQPLVENALYHGIKNKRGRGMITIAASVDAAGCLLLAVKDDGIGISEQRLVELRELLASGHLPEKTGDEVSGGFGLHNVHQRIRLYYGEAYGVELYSEASAGTRVILKIPHRLGGTIHEKSDAG